MAVHAGASAALGLIGAIPIVSAGFDLSFIGGIQAVVAMGSLQSMSSGP